MSNARHEESIALAGRKYQLKNNTNELKAVKFLFSYEEVESNMYRSGLKRKRLCKLLEE